MNEIESKNETKRIQITLQKNIIDELDKISDKYNLTKSNILTMLIKKYAKEEFGNFEK